jgi:hypothetical protein
MNVKRATHSEIVKQLKRAEGHLRALIGMFREWQGLCVAGATAARGGKRSFKSKA